MDTSQKGRGEMIEFLIISRIIGGVAMIVGAWQLGGAWAGIVAAGLYLVLFIDTGPIT